VTAQPSLPGVTPPTDVGDPSGVVYTPDSLALALVRHVAPRLPSRPTVLEAQVGGGAIVRACRRALRPSWVIGVDIDPEAAGLALVDRAIVGDWPALAAEVGFEVAFAPGNPPFGRAVGIEVTIAHVRASIECARVCVQVLPGAYVSGQEFHRGVWARRPPAEVVRITSRPWPDRLREVVALVWDRDHVGPTTVGTLEWAP
jgi:hypothetical protein